MRGGSAIRGGYVADRGGSGTERTRGGRTRKPAALRVRAPSRTASGLAARWRLGGGIVAGRALLERLSAIRHPYIYGGCGWRIPDRGSFRPLRQAVGALLRPGELPVFHAVGQRPLEAPPVAMLGIELKLLGDLPLPQRAVGGGDRLDHVVEHRLGLLVLRLLRLSLVHEFGVE